MRSYVGPLLDSLDRDDVLEVSGECSDSRGHSLAAINQTIVAICLGKRVKLTRNKNFPSHDEIPGVIEGRAYGMSHHYQNHRVILALELDSGECVGADVSDPGDWDWEVSNG